MLTLRIEKVLRLILMMLMVMAAVLFAASVLVICTVRVYFLNSYYYQPKP
jgi:hypothetical protein